MPDLVYEVSKNSFMFYLNNSVIKKFNLVTFFYIDIEITLSSKLRVFLETRNVERLPRPNGFFPCKILLQVTYPLLIKDLSDFEQSLLSVQTLSVCPTLLDSSF